MPGAARRRSEEAPVKTILVATDGSAPAAEALDVAIDLARDAGAALHVLAVHPQRVPGRGGAGPAITEVEEPDGAQHVAEAAAENARSAGVAATAHAGRGDVVECITDAAASVDADL